MKHKYKLLLFLLLLAIAFFLTRKEPTNMRVDFIRTPQETVINSQQPVFSWQIAPSSKSQKAYQIIVSRSAESLKGDVWNSEKVCSDNSFAVVYQGETLKPETDYYWRVRYWDKHNLKGQYSDPQKFTTASVAARNRSSVSDNPLGRRLDKNVKIEQVADGEYLLDFGRAAFGTLSLELQSSCDTTLTIHVGEQLDSAGRIERKPKGTIRYQQINLDVNTQDSIYKVLFAADKRNTSKAAIPIPEQWGIIMPFRYVEVCGVSPEQAQTLHALRDVMYGYREDLASFSSSNSLLDSIWEISRYTIEATDFLSYYIDGDRERIPYEADAYINQLAHYCVDSEYAIGKKTLEYFMSHATWPTEWILHTILIAYQDYIYTGDKRLITQYYETLKSKSLYELGREDGLISAKSEHITPEYLVSIGFKARGKWKLRDIVDWPAGALKYKNDKTKKDKVKGERDSHDMKPINTVVNCFHYQTLCYMTQFATITGHSEDSILFDTLSAKVRQSINEKLFDAEKGIYIDGEGSEHSSLHSNMFAVAFGVVEPQNIKRVAEFIKSRGMACSVYGAQYLFEALYMAGEAQYALDLMTNKSDRGWYNMIRLGSTMTFEAWDIKYKDNLDWNHAWGAAPANLIPRYMWGITPSSAGYKSGVMKPQLADLEHSAIAVPTLNGVIHASYTSDDGVKRYTVTLPANMSLRFELVDSLSRMTLNSKPVEGCSVDLFTGKNIIVVENNR